MALRREKEDREEKGKKQRLAKGWYVKFAEIGRAAEFAEMAGHKRVAQKLKRTTTTFSEERKRRKF